MTTASPTLQIFRVRPSAVVPHYATQGAAGLDLSADLDAPVVLEPLGRARIPTGLVIALPRGYEGQVRPRSGLAAKHGITVLNAPGTIDEDYRGELAVLLVNLSNRPFTISHGERVAQLIVAPVTQVAIEVRENLADLGSTLRGVGGFGSTGR
jgi:dUTP pyrophosphatase